MVIQGQDQLFYFQLTEYLYPLIFDLSLPQKQFYS